MHVIEWNILIVLENELWCKVNTHLQEIKNYVVNFLNKFIPFNGGKCKIVLLFIFNLIWSNKR